MGTAATLGFRPDRTGSKSAPAFERAADLSAIALFTAMIVLPQSYIEIKLPVLLLFVMIHGLSAMSRFRLRVEPSDLTFYAIAALIGLVWGLIGIGNGSSTAGVLSSLKLYVAWNALFLVIISLYRSSCRIEVLHRAFVTSTLLICVINAVALADVALDLGALNAERVEELGLQVGLYGAYVRIHANNIASLFFLLGYLIAYKLCTTGLRQQERWVNIALCLGVLLAVLSGRRALWIALAITPAIIVAMAALAGQSKHLRWRVRTIVSGYLLAATFGLVAAFALTGLADLEVLEYLRSAFDDEDERTIQKGFLFAAFEQRPFFGSGFGGVAGYVRSDEMPWMYELTYHQMLFNFGIVGCVLLLLVFVTYAAMACRSLQRFPDGARMRLGMLVGFLCILVGVYSNPYLHFFDSMLFIMFFVSLARDTAPRQRVEGRWP